jgi:hypothetical protein
MNYNHGTYIMPHEYLDRLFFKEDAKPKKINSHISPKLWVYLKKVDVSKLSPMALEMFTLTEQRKRKHEVKKILGLTESRYIVTRIEILKAANLSVEIPEVINGRDYRYVSEIKLTKEQINMLSTGAAIYYDLIHNKVNTIEIKNQYGISPYWMKIYRKEIRSVCT